ncbi:MAG: NAD-dependent epimerase/dehydratase family protein [Nitriliruptoraceae bacterium]|nr:NAD-dependent epimerase/dehydratase family protein [Nitriliruptoraceae bacterium]
MTTIAITGAGGQLGTRLVRTLGADESVERLVGIDHQPPVNVMPRRFEYRPADVRDPGLASALKGVDVLIHLAARVDPMRDEDAMRAVNVTGTRAVLQAASDAGVARVVLPSSVVVYGAHPDNDLPLTEDSALRGIESLPYAEHLVTVERSLEGWLAALDTPPRVTLLRFALMAGPGMDNVITRSFEAPRIPVIAGHRPPMQFLHPDDAVAAIVHVVEQDLDGVYNVSADGWLSFDEVTAIVGRRTVEVPEEVAWSVTERLWTFGIGAQPPGLLAMFMHPAVMSAARLEATGWSPKHSNRDAVAAMAAEHHGYWSVPGLRVRRRDVARAGIVAGLLAAWGVTAIWRRLRR